MNEHSVAPGESWTRMVSVWTDSTKTEKEDVLSATLKVYDRPGGELVWDGLATPDDGDVELALSSDQTDDKPGSVLYWRARATLSGNRVYDIDEGKLIISA